MVANFIIALLLVGVYVTSRKAYHLMYILFHVLCALWGMTVPSMNVPFIRDINSIAIPILGSICGIVGCIYRLKESITEHK